MESSMSLSPVPSDLSQQNQESLSVSPSSSPRKRSIHDLEGPIESSPVHKRALIVPYDSENQENRDPAGSVTAKEATQTQKAASPWGAPPSVEILVGSGPTAAIPGSTGSLLVCTSSSGDMTSQRAGSGSPVKMDSSSARASKKRKLSPVSQDLKQQDKEARERQKQEEKAKREEEKRLRAEEKKKREEEREEERRLKEEDKKKREAEREEKRKAKDEERAAKEAAKEEERKRKEEEKLKKERAQPKLNSFFAKPSSPRPKVAPTEENSVTVQTPISIATESGEQHPTRPDLSDYQKAFPEFFLQSHTQIAPLHRFERDPQALEHVRQAIDATLNVTGTDSSFKPSFRPSEVFKYIPFRRRCGRSGPSVKDLLRRMQNAGDETLMDLDPQDQHKAAEEAHKALRQVPMKVLRFGEDVRPPYQGTFTRPMGEVAARKLARNPYHRGLPEVNYDYDSEAEWEEPEEEGEDLDSENDDEESDDGDDDMAEFLDDEDDALVGGKRRLIVGDLEPNCTGLCWAADGVTAEMKAYQIETISDAVRFPIDPFSTAYWEKPKVLDATTAHAPSKSTLDVFRVPNPTTTTPANAARSIMNGKVKKPFPPEQLPEFRTAVESSDLSKVGTIEILKKRFPKVAKDTLKATLEQYAVRVGQKETDKRWVWR